MKTLLAAVGLLVPVMAAAHPLGNFTTNRYAALTVEPRALRVVYALDLAELPAYREIRVVDTDGDEQHLHGAQPPGASASLVLRAASRATRAIGACRTSNAGASASACSR